MDPEIKQLTLRRPDDWHLHLRDGEMLRTVVPHTADHFHRALVMPNLKPPVCTVEQALAYRGRILDALPANTTFDPRMTLYLTDLTTPSIILQAAAEPLILAAKLYPAGATTHSDSGVTDIDALDPVWGAMAETGLVLCVHAEVTSPTVDIFDREARFLIEVLAPLLERHPTLRVVIEHATTAEAVQLARTSSRLAASITAHHLMYDRNALFEGGIRPHRYCLPVLKRREHRDALVEAATSGDPCFFLGTDSAPHLRTAKETTCGCAGMYTAPVAIAMVAEVFEAHEALDQLENFCSNHGARFYGVDPSPHSLTISKRDWTVPLDYPVARDAIRPAAAGETLSWAVH